MAGKFYAIQGYDLLIGPADVFLEGERLEVNSGPLKVVYYILSEQPRTVPYEEFLLRVWEAHVANDSVDHAVRRGLKAIFGQGPYPFQRNHQGWAFTGVALESGPPSPLVDRDGRRRSQRRWLQRRQGDDVNYVAVGRRRRERRERERRQEDRRQQAKGPADGVYRRAGDLTEPAQI